MPWWAGVTDGTGVRRYVGEALALAKRYPQARGHVFAAREVAADPIGAMARVVADHSGQSAKPPR